jgi:hypothetical protein
MTIFLTTFAGDLAARVRLIRGNGTKTLQEYQRPRPFLRLAIPMPLATLPRVSQRAMQRRRTKSVTPTVLG